jgi:hypothetical protein
MHSPASARTRNPITATQEAIWLAVAHFHPLEPWGSAQLSIHHYGYFSHAAIRLDERPIMTVAVQPEPGGRAQGGVDGSTHIDTLEPLTTRDVIQASEER